MADRNSYRITARAEGKGQKTFDFGDKTLHINADENTVYQFEEVGMSSIPDNIVFSRKGNDLWIMPEGKDKAQAIIEGYFSAKNATFGAMGVDGSLYSYGIEDLKSAVSSSNVAVEHTLATEVSSASATTTESSVGSGLSIPVVSTAALTLGGIAVAAGSGSHSSASDDKNHPKNNNHSVEKNTAPNNDPEQAATPEIAAKVTKTLISTTDQDQSELTPPLANVELPREEGEVLVPKISNGEELTFVDVTRSGGEQDIPIEYQGQRADYYSGGNYNHAPNSPDFVELGTLTRGNAKVGDLIARVFARDPDGDNVRYYLTGDTRGMYSIDPNSGRITLTYAGAQAVNQGKELPELKVIAYDGSISSATSVLKFSSEENHNPSSTTPTNHAPEQPTFHDNVVNFVKGQAHAGDKVTTVHAKDPENDEITYYLQGASRDVYDINHYTGVVTLTQTGANLVNSGKDLPNVQVIAYDGQLVSRTADLDVPNTTDPIPPVRPINHAPEQPTFHNNVVNFVKGQAHIGDKVTTVHAKDPENDEVTYYLQGASRDVYDINHYTGVVTLTQAGANLVNSGKDLPNVQVVAYDGQLVSRTADLDVPNTTDPAPIHPINHAPETPTFENVADFSGGNAQAGSIVTIVRATDADGDRLNYYLINNNPHRFYDMNIRTGVVTLTQAGANHVNAGGELPELRILAADGKSYSPIATLDLSAHQSVINHAPTIPTFESNTDHFIQGQTQAGTQVATARATDADGDSITYYLANNPGGVYTINAQSGVVTLTQAGANHVNAGYNLPDLEVIAHDGKESSAASRLDVGNTSSIPNVDKPSDPVEPSIPTVLPTPHNVNQEPKFQSDSTFIDTRDLAKVDKPYFIDILDHGGGNFGYIRNVWEGYGHGATISYKFADSASDEGISWGNNRYSFKVTGFQKYSAEQQQAVRDVISLYEEQTNLKFVEKQSWETANFKFYLDDLKSSRTYAYNRFVENANKQNSEQADNIQITSNQGDLCPCCGKALAQIAAEFGESANSNHGFKAGYAWYGGDVHINSDVYGGNSALSKDTPFFEIPGKKNVYTRGGFGVLMHELGHSVGLDHLFSQPNVISQFSHEDKTALSIMSYTNDLKQTIHRPGYRPMKHDVSATQFGIFDLAALHYRYGVNESQHAGNTTYTFKSFNKDVLGNDIYIWDGSGIDTFDGSQERMNLHINLTPGSWIYRGDHKADTLVYDRNGKIVENQMFIGFGTQIENLKGGSGHDELIGNEANNHIEGGAGNDFIDGGAGNDWLEGGAGNDRLFGGDGDDILDGGEGRDIMNGGAGNDTYYVDNYGDQITDSSGIDTVYSSIDYTLGQGLENLYLTGNENLSGNGNSSDNILWGNAGDNHLSGGYGNDTLYGGAGNDVLSGGAGSDTFIIDGLGLDTLLDFNAREGDVIQLDHNVFINLDLGRVSADNFVSGANAKARDYNDHLIYNTTNNTLYYDVDGSGSQAAVAIAKFADNFNDEITANSFRVL